MQVALQFPDDLMDVSVTIVRQLQQLTIAEIVILADTSFGRWNVCCFFHQLQTLCIGDLFGCKHCFVHQTQQKFWLSVASAICNGDNHFRQVKTMCSNLQWIVLWSMAYKPVITGVELVRILVYQVHFKCARLYYKFSANALPLLKM